ncbi:MAG: PP2C family serine/threonine-protein phosphatase [Pseudonocardiaceae bacterium]
MSVAQWSVAAASATGQLHVRAALPCQDRFAWSWSAREVLAMAVADGAGCAPRAHLGAQAAVHAVISIAQRLGRWPPPPAALAPSAFTGLFFGARAAVRYLAWRMQRPLEEFATTLSVAVLWRDHLLLGQVGDGLLTVRLRTGQIISPAPPARGEYANETYLLTDDVWSTRLTFACLPAAAVEGFALSTDGLRLVATSDPVTGTPHRPFYDDMFDAVARGADSHSLRLFLEQVDDRTGDDKCLLVVARRS